MTNAFTFIVPVLAKIRIGQPAMNMEMVFDAAIRVVVVFFITILAAWKNRIICISFPIERMIRRMDHGQSSRQAPCQDHAIASCLARSARGRLPTSIYQLSCIQGFSCFFPLRRLLISPVFSNTNRTTTVSTSGPPKASINSSLLAHRPPSAFKSSMGISRNRSL